MTFATSFSNLAEAEHIPCVTADEAFTLMQTSFQRFMKVIESLHADDWTRPTACTEWNVHDVVAHQAGGYASGISYKEMIRQYSKIRPGRLLDRIDIHIEVPRVDYEKLSGDRLGESSASIRARVQAARDIQRVRFTTPESRTSAIVSSDIICNADMRVGEIRQFCRLQACPEQGRRDEGQRLMRAATLCCA